MRLIRMLAPAVPFALVLATLPESSTTASAVQKGWYDRAVKGIQAKFEPAEAKPGQTIAFKLTVDLNEGYYTYPTLQPDKNAAGFVNAIKFPEAGTVVFVGPVVDPKEYETKAEPDLMIKDLRTSMGTVVFTRQAVVSPKAGPGATTVKLTSFKLMVCDKNNCFPGKVVPIEAPLKVLDGPAVPVAKEYAAEVAKALAGK